MPALHYFIFSFIQTQLDWKIIYRVERRFFKSSWTEDIFISHSTLRHWNILGPIFLQLMSRIKYCTCTLYHIPHVCVTCRCRLHSDWDKDNYLASMQYVWAAGNAQWIIYRLRPQYDGRHFADAISKCFFFSGKEIIVNQINFHWALFFKIYLIDTNCHLWFGYLVGGK